MEGPISISAINRLPSAIKALGETHQKAYIYLRLRKSDHEIATHLNHSIDETSEIIRTVRNSLIKAGQLDLIEDPKFVSMHSDDPETGDLPIPSNEIDLDNKLIIKEFLSILQESINQLPQDQSHLLRLKYKHHMSAREILGFCNKMGLSLIPGKEPKELKEQDIFYALNKAMKGVLSGLKSHYLEDDSFGMENLKYIFEEMGI